MCGRAHQVHPTPCAGAGFGSHGRPERAVRLWRRRYDQYAGGAGPPRCAFPHRFVYIAPGAGVPRISVEGCSVSASQRTNLPMDLRRRILVLWR
jgi:hypothetical protein